MPEGDLPDILTLLQLSKTNTTRFNETWSQGRSAFGGLTAALAVCAMEKALPAPMPMRSLMASFIAPLPPGKVSVHTKIVRQGKNVTQLTADVIADDVICLQAMGVFGNPRDTLAVRPELEFNPAPRLQQEKLSERPGQMPPFLKYFEGSWTGGGMPFSGTRDISAQLWTKHRSDMSNFPVERIVSIADIPPPVILSHYTQPNVPSSSLTWSLEFVQPPETIKDEWFYLDSVIDHAENGYCQQSSKIFSESGKLCALSRQCMVYFD
jgi:acyl-CoA thioesterase